MLFFLSFLQLRLGGNDVKISDTSIAKSSIVFDIFFLSRAPSSEPRSFTTIISFPLTYTILHKTDLTNIGRQSERRDGGSGGGGVVTLE